MFIQVGYVQPSVLCLSRWVMSSRLGHANPRPATIHTYTCTYILTYIHNTCVMYAHTLNHICLHTLLHMLTHLNPPLQPRKRRRMRPVPPHARARSTALSSSKECAHGQASPSLGRCGGRIGLTPLLGVLPSPRFRVKSKGVIFAWKQQRWTTHLKRLASCAEQSGRPLSSVLSHPLP